MERVCKSMDKRGLFDHLWNDDQVVGLSGRIRESLLAGEPVAIRVWPKHVYGIRGMSGGFYPADIDRLELFNVSQNLGELGLELGCLRIGKFEAGKVGCVTDIKIGAHERSLVKGGLALRFNPLMFPTP